MKFVVNGGRRLDGEIQVLGSKNAALPILAATLLTKRPCILKNIPLIDDVFTMLEILKSLGSEITWLEERTVRIVNSDIDPKKIDNSKVEKIRASILVVGPLLGRFGYVRMATPGGCLIGVRPVDAHMDALRDLGALVSYDEKADIYEIKPPLKHKWGSRVTLKELSVTGTENLMMLGALLPSITIELAAAEPHVEDLGKFLKLLGVKIAGLRGYEIFMKGLKHEGRKTITYSIMNDPIEAGTFMALGAASKSRLKIKGAPLSSLLLPLQKLKEFGVPFEIVKDDLIIHGSKSDLKGVRIQTQPYPGFPTDLQAPFAVLATQAKGETLIFDTLYEGRLKYIGELEKMGAKAKILDTHQALIFGPTPLKGKEVQSLDLRAGATLVIAALIAEGQSVLNGIEQIDRGYEKLEERLKPLGASIKRID